MNKNKEVTVEVEVSKAIDHFWRPVFMALIVVAIGFATYLGYGAYSEHQEQAAQERLFAIQKQLDNKKEELEKAEAGDDTAASAKDGKSAKDEKAAKKADTKKADKIKLAKTPETLEQNFGSILTAYDQFIAENKGNKASFMAAVQAAGLSLAYSDLNRAEKALVPVAGVVKSGDLFYGLVKSQYGSVLMDLKKFDQAAIQFEELTTAKEQKYFLPQAMLRLGICYIEMKEYSKAESTFSKLIADHPTTQASNEAKKMRKLIALRQGSAQ